MDNLDAVAMMRRIRDDLSRKPRGMRWEEEREFILSGTRLSTDCADNAVEYLFDTGKNRVDRWG
uniref:Uncharacterized protein n=1 Tax=Candidatus Kentrum sp. DK TaxID=2126562 RepID=A0A450SHL2_9GAMM|nr:MAG: hypothetical protein BECKDK2373B_GA0170837_103931 [Candidatus Kentron sp. DK]